MREGVKRTAAEAAALARELAAGNVQALAESWRDLDAREHHTVSVRHLVVRRARAALLGLSHARDQFFVRVVCERARALVREREFVRTRCVLARTQAAGTHRWSIAPFCSRTGAGRRCVRP